MSRKIGQKLLRRRVAVWAALSCLSPLTNGSQAQDHRANIPELAQLSNEIAIPHDRAAAASFEARWAPLDDEFVLGGNGVLAPVGQYDPTTSKGLEGSQNGNIDSNFALLFVAPNIAQVAIDLPDVVNQFGNTQAPGTESADVPECGPSPLAPDEIKALVEASAARHGVDAALAVAIASVESSFDQNRNSGAGARGPMQLMPTTAERFSVTDVCDPVSNIEGGVRYLRSLLDEFENPLLVAAAYNAGEARIYEYGGIPPFAETVGYVAKVLNYQLGLPAIVAGRPSSFDPSANDVPSEASNRDVGVIERRAPGTFVGGVMQF